jgi:hypothetical protein
LSPYRIFSFPFFTFAPNPTFMIIGVPKEIKTNENRVALTPAGALELTKRGHTLYVQEGAGEHSGFQTKLMPFAVQLFFQPLKKCIRSLK